MILQGGLWSVNASVYLSVKTHDFFFFSMCGSINFSMNEPRSEQSVQIDDLNRKAWDLIFNNPQRTRILSTQAVEIAIQNGDQEGTAQAYLNLGWAELMLASFQQSRYYFMKSLSLFQDLQNKDGEMKALNGLGVMSQDMGLYEEAVDFYLQSLRKSEENDNRERQIAALNNIGELHQALGNLDDARDFFQRARTLAESMPVQPESMSSILLNSAITEYQKDHLDSAHLTLHQALMVAEAVNNQMDMGKILNYLGLIAFRKHNSDKAIEFNLRSLAIYEQVDNPQGKAEVLLFLASIYLEIEDFSSVIEYLDEAGKIISSLDIKLLESRSHEINSRLYEKQGDYRKALEYHKKHDRLQTEINTAELSKRLRGLSLRHELQAAQTDMEIYKKHNQELQKAYNQIQIISQIGKDITSQLDTEVMIWKLYQNISSLMDIQSLLLGYCDEEKGVIVFDLPIEEGKPLPPIILPMDAEDSLAAWCVQHRKELLLNSREEVKEYLKEKVQLSQGKISQSFMFLPLLVENRVIGIFSVQNFDPGAYSYHHFTIIKALASYIAIALENSIAHKEINRLNNLILAEKNGLEQAYGKISHLANHDSLTQLPNRHLVHQLLENAIKVASHNNERVAVLYLDLDHFKPINDQLGHDAGDKALRIIAKRVSRVIRSSDTLGRVGGDEFILILEAIKQRSSVERICQELLTIHQEPVVVENQPFTVGLSIGIAMFPEDGKTLNTLIRKADQAMYSVKKNRKNNFRFYRDMIHLQESV